VTGDAGGVSWPPSYEELAAENAQLRALVAELSEMNRVLTERVAELEARLGQTPRNSHRPPSSQGYEKPAPQSRRERTDRRPAGWPAGA